MYNIENETEIRISNDTSRQIDPIIFGDTIVWSDNRHGNWDVYLYYLENGTERRITNDPFDQKILSFYGDRILFRDYSSGDWNLYLYNYTISGVAP